MNTSTLEHMTDTVQDVAHKVADRAPDIASTVGRNARSTAETVGHTVSDAVVKLAHMTPFIDAPAPPRQRGRWMFRAALLATIAGIALWVVKRRTARPWYEVNDAPAASEGDVATERRLASAGH